MATRTVKIKGSAYSTADDVSITVVYNGATVYEGVVPTTVDTVVPSAQPSDSANWDGELATFTTTTDLTGSIPMTILVTSGTLFFATLEMNYIGPVLGVEPTDPAVDMNKDDPSTFTNVVVTSTTEHFGEVNVNSEETDG